MARPYYMSFDPGTATGWSTFSEEGEVLDKGICRGHEELMNFLMTISEIDRPKVIIYEDFTLFQSKALQQSGSDMPASQAIGVIKMFGQMCKAEMVKQHSNILGIGQKLAGVSLPKNHDHSHDISAYVHGVYYLIKNHIREVAI